MNLMLNRKIAGVKKSHSALNIERMPDIRENEKIPPNKMNHPPVLSFLEYPMNRQYPTRHKRNMILNWLASKVITAIFCSF
jgi:hypothetical protein